MAQRARRSAPTTPTVSEPAVPIVEPEVLAAELLAERQLDAEQEAEEDAEIARINTRIRQENRELAARRNQQATNSSQAAAPDTGTAAGPVGAGLYTRAFQIGGPGKDHGPSPS